MNANCMMNVEMSLRLDQFFVKLAGLEALPIWIFFDEAPFEKLIPGVFLIVIGGMLIAGRERRKRIEAAPVIAE